MTIKQKFSSIDQSKLTADQKAFLDKIKDVTKNFTNTEMNKKVEAPLDGFIAKAKEKMPEAIKSIPVRRTAKSKAKPSQTTKPKRTVMSLAKEIRKQGESWKDAQMRARKTMKEDSQSLSKTVESELDKLTKLVRSQKDKEKLAGISGTNIKRDAVRTAKPRGARRVTHSGETSNQYGTFSNKLGRKYYESRDRHSDRLAPNYPKNAPLLENGAYLTDPNFGGFQNQVLEDGGLFSSGRPKSALMRDRKNVNHSEDYEVRYSKPRPSRTGYSGNRNFAGGGKVESLTKELYRLQRELNSNRLGTYRLGDVSQEEIDRKKERDIKLARFNEVLKELRESYAKFELGGVMDTDLAGHIGGKLGTGDPSMLDGFSNTGYTGLVGETGAMSSAEMFDNGGQTDNFNQRYFKRLIKTYEENEDENRHSENVLLLAENFGTQDEKLEAKRILKIHDEEGNLSTENGKNRRKLSLILIQKARAEMQKNDLKFEFGGDFQSSVYHNGGEMMQNQQIIDDASQHYVNYYLGQGASQGIYKKGGKLLSQSERYIDELKGLTGLSKFAITEFIEKNNLSNTDVLHIIVGIGRKQIKNIDVNTAIIGFKNNPEAVKLLKFSRSDEAMRMAKGGMMARGGKVNFKKLTSDDFDLGEIVYDDENKDYGTIIGIYDDYPSDKFEVRLNSNGMQYTEYLRKVNSKDDKGTKEELDEAINSYANLVKNYPQNNYPKQIQPIMQKGGMMAKGGGIRQKNGRKYPLSRNCTNDHRKQNKNQKYEVLQNERKFMAGGSMETPRIYVADLEAYNKGKLVGEYLDLTDYNDADELMDAIQEVLKKSGGEEYAIHDYENFPSSMYSEYMGKRDFEELYEMIDLAKQNDLPLEVVQEIVSQYGEGGVDEFYGKYDDAEDFAMQLVDDIGIESFNNFEYYLDISETDKRLLSQEMADSYVQDIRDKDGGNRLIEEAGLNVDEYEDASDESKEEMLDLASSMVNDEYYDTWYEGLNDPKHFLVDELGMYSVEDFAKANFVRVDYDRLADALEQDYTFIEHDGELYVFNIK